MQALNIHHPNTREKCMNELDRFVGLIFVFDTNLEWEIKGLVLIAFFLIGPVVAEIVGRCSVL